MINGCCDASIYANAKILPGIFISPAGWVFVLDRPENTRDGMGIRMGSRNLQETIRAHITEVTLIGYEDAFPWSIRSCARGSEPQADWAARGETDQLPGLSDYYLLAVIDRHLTSAVNERVRMKSLHWQC